MDEQSKRGISVHYVIEEQLKSLSYFPDFTIIPSLNLIIYVPDLNNLKHCIATRDPQLVKDLKQDYDCIKHYAKKYSYE